MRRSNKKKMYLILGIVILMISVGYAILNANLAINGTTKIANAIWNVHFENYQQTSNSTVTPASGKAPVISGTTTTEISYEVDFTTPGDVYEFTVDVKNGGTIDAMIESVQTKIKIGNGTEVVLTDANLPNYLEHYFSYSDGSPIESPQKLDANTKETLLVSVKFKSDITSAQLEAASGKTIKFTEQINYVQKDNTAIPITHSVSFSNDDWSTIVGVVTRGNPNVYHVGDTKTVELGNSFGTHTLRIANMSTPSECSTAGFSQTACGFVLEFSDIITEHNMNPAGEYKGTQYDYGWNVDGWPATSMRTYLNDTNDATSIINALPEVLRNAIIDTTVVSGHGSTGGETNFTSTDKLYLLSAHEVWEDVDGNAISGPVHYDTAYHNTRQLDYYNNLGVTTSNYSGAIKKNGTSDYTWWLRSAISNVASNFYGVYITGNCANPNAYYTIGIGVSPAFRIG